LQNYSGYERTSKGQSYDGKGIEWAFRNYLNGKDGKTKIAKKDKEPIRDVNEIDPQDGMMLYLQLMFIFRILHIMHTKTVRIV
jgi:cell division protein FtsI/penicillin-binding protein 2